MFSGLCLSKIEQIIRRLKRVISLSCPCRIETIKDGLDGFPKRSCTQRNPSPVGSAPAVVRSLSANFHRASRENNRFWSSGSALVAKTLNERLFVQLEAVYGDGRGYMVRGLIKVVAVLPFCKEVLSS